MSEPKKMNLEYLWKSFLKGDDKSFSLIYQQHINGLFLYGSKLSADRELVRDCIQEIFIDLFLKRKKVSREIINLKSYLFVALRNCMVKKMGKNRIFESIGDNEEASELPFHIEYEFRDHLIELEISNEIKEKLNACIKKLPPRQKEIIYLKFEEDMDYPDIARMLKISVESARKLLYRALLTLRKTIDPSITQAIFLFLFKKSPVSMSMF